MRVLIAASTYPPDPGGPSIHAKAQYEWLKEQGLNPDLVALAFYRNWPHGVRHLLYAKKLYALAKHFDVVYAYDAVGSGIPAFMAARFRGKKFVVRVGGDVAWERKAEKGETRLSLMEWYERGEHKKNLMFLLSRWLLKRADAIIVPSPLLAQLYRKQYCVPMQKITIVSNPVPKAQAELAEQEKTIVFASRLVAYKNLFLVLKAFKATSSQFPDVNLLIMGDGPERGRLEDLSRKIGIEKRVLFTGSVSQDEVIKRTARCLFVIAPALTEFNPNYVLQAIAFKKPFLISKENGLPFSPPEELQFDPRDQSELESRLEYLLSREGYREARKKVEVLTAGGSWEDVMMANMKVIESV